MRNGSVDHVLSATKNAAVASIHWQEPFGANVSRLTVK